MEAERKYVTDMTVNAGDRDAVVKAVDVQRQQDKKSIT
jgi:hypothetical protein